MDKKMKHSAKDYAGRLLSAKNEECFLEEFKKMLGDFIKEIAEYAINQRICSNKELAKIIRRMNGKFNNVVYIVNKKRLKNKLKRNELKGLIMSDPLISERLKKYL